jgi:putative restriction endonuclease
MALTDLTDPDAVRQATAEFDRIGRTEFLKKHGFGQAREYFLVVDDHRYDSKAIAGAAHFYQLGEKLPHDEFSGGEKTVQRTLEKLGFRVQRISPDDVRRAAGTAVPPSSAKKERVFGEIPGTSEGDLFASRKELAAAGIHRPWEAGICFSQTEGAESLVLSGGFPDDSDRGHVIVYTGHGGQDRATRKQVKDQELTLGNKALALNKFRRLPVRVVRGEGGDPEYSPGSGYRYDGLYRVIDHWHEPGKEGFRVWRFKLQKEGESEPWSDETKAHSRPRRVEVTRSELVRDEKLAKNVKKLHKYRCQVCLVLLDTPLGPYAEAAHIKPLGYPHYGPDSIDNMLCLCPNCHRLYDNYAFVIDDDLSFVIADDVSLPYIEDKKLTVDARHRISSEYLKYHREIKGP